MAISNTAYKCKNSSVKMIQHVPTSEITTCIWTPLLEHLTRHPTTLQGTRKMGAVSSSGPFLPTACSLDFRKAKKEMVKTKPKPKATPLSRDCREIWLLNSLCFMRSNVWEIETMVELMPLWKSGGEMRWKHGLWNWIPSKLITMPWKKSTGNHSD